MEKIKQEKVKHVIIEDIKSCWENS